MKAAVLTANGCLDVKDVPLADIQPDECRVKIAYTGVCSSDIFRGYEKGAYHYPLVMGHELAGEVEAAGSVVTTFKKGDKVAVFPLRPCFHCEPCERHDYAQCLDYGYYGSRCDGGFCEFLNVKEWNLLRVPSGVSLRDAALTEPMSVVVHALRRAEITKEFEHRRGSLAVIGSGFLGLLALQIVKSLYPSLTPTLFDRNAFKLDIASEHGAAAVLLKDKAGWDAYLADPQRRFDVVIEASGAPENFVRSLQMLKQGGAVVWMGNITDDLTLPKNIVSSILRKEIRMIGTWNSSYKSPKNDAYPHIALSYNNFFFNMVSLQVGERWVNPLPDVASRAKWEP